MDQTILPNEQVLTELLDLIAHAERLRSLAVDYKVTKVKHDVWGDSYTLTVFDTLYPGETYSPKTTETLLVFTRDPREECVSPIEERLERMRTFLEKIEGQAFNRTLLLERREDLLNSLSKQDLRLLGLP